MTEIGAAGVAEGDCSSCGQPDLLCAGGLLGQPICPHCTLANEVAPLVLANLLGLNAGNIVELEGTRIDLATPLGATLLARKVSERHRRLGPAGLLDWSGAVVFPEIAGQAPKAAAKREA